MRGLLFDFFGTLVEYQPDRSRLGSPRTHELAGSMGIEAHVSAVVLSVEHGRLKPHPSIYDAALEQIGCHASEVTFVGDSYEADYIGPLRAGMSALLIDPGRIHDIPEPHRLSSVLDLVEPVSHRPEG